MNRPLLIGDDDFRLASYSSEEHLEHLDVAILRLVQRDRYAERYKSVGGAQAKENSNFPGCIFAFVFDELEGEVERHSFPVLLIGLLHFWADSDEYPRQLVQLSFLSRDIDFESLFLDLGDVV